MSAAPISRRGLRAMAVGAFSLLVLAGCTTTQRDASDYGGTRDDFLEGCVATAEADNDAKGTEVKIASPQNWCECVFKAIEKNVPFDDFKKANSELRDNGGALPKKIQEAYDSCDPADAG